MVLEVKLYSEKKGSNPGGKVEIFGEREPFHAYLKYCPGSRLRITGQNGRRNPQAFRATNQPIYEVITLALAKRLGLIVPEHYVLVNNENRTKITYEKEVHSRINEKMPFYFVSRLISVPSPEESEKKRAALVRDKLYRDLLMVSDISNKEQNYRYDPTKDLMVYLDLGCSFVHAVGGFLLPSTIKFPSDNRQTEKRATQIAKEHHLITADDQNLIPLEELISMESVRVPLLGSSERTASVDSLLSEEEIEEITRMLLFNLIRIKQKYNRDDRLIKE